MPYSVKIDKQSCLSSGRCVMAEPDAFGFDDDHLADALPGAGSLTPEALLEVARACPSFAITVLDEAGNEVDPSC